MIIIIIILKDNNITIKFCTYRLKDAMEELAPRNKIKIVPSKYGASGGAAIAAAIACQSSSDDK